MWLDVHVINSEKDRSWETTKSCVCLNHICLEAIADLSWLIFVLLEWDCIFSECVYEYVMFT